jgi:hypothetical protein
MRQGDVVWASLDKERICIVVEVRDSVALVLYGTGTYRDGEPSAYIDPKRRYGLRFKLSKPTYFYARSHRRITESDVTKRAGVCPFDLYERVCELVSEAALKLHPAPTKGEGP